MKDVRLKDEEKNKEGDANQEEEDLSRQMFEVAEFQFGIH